ncbi:MAG: CDP-alcohol phosphatidyltransferase family protein [Anaerolineae bacterium]|nr:CDP-alcohol phosphatidyltransferase family protein [Anaerolineae bacterium]MCB0222799.1 CDP-alcohol phosphatidyltransferase family protein [Anaerolineae bacterium]MCB9105196.1 CDP-alcohol phosphatidyltransferase family protein [Anaerolineales bacterium]
MFSDIARKYSRSFLEPLARFISTTGVSPNVITIVGFILMVGVAFVLAQGHFLLGGILITGVAIFDAVDGTLARMMGRTSRFGAFLDSTLDRFSEAVIFLGLFVYYINQDGQLELILIYATVVGSLMVSYARARAEGIGVPLKDGLFTRFERVFLLVVGLIFNWLTPVLWLLAIFSNLTAFQRMYLVWRITGGEEGG